MKSKEIRENEWLLEKFRKLKRQAILNLKHYLSRYVGKTSFSLMLSGVVFLITAIILLLSEVLLI